MRTRQTTEYIHEGRLVAEVDVSLIETDSEWSPYYSIGDVRKMEAVREALRKGDLKAAARLGRVYEMKPVAAE
jgi:FAD synthase